MQAEPKYYPAVVLGATFAGIGAAYANKEGALIIERTALVGHEFINSFNTGEGWNDTLLTSEGEGLRDELLERDIVSDDGRVHLPALSPVLYNRMDRDGLHVLLLTDVLEMEEHEDYIELTIHHASGISRIRTQQLIDTRTEAVPASSIRSKYINAMLYDGGDGALRLPATAARSESSTLSSASSSSATIAGHKSKVESEQTLIQFAEGKLEGEVTVKLAIDAGDNWTQARAKLNRFWQQRPEAWRDWTICAVATSFEVEVDQSERVRQGHRLLLPSAAHRNPLEAFEAGFVAMASFASLDSMEGSVNQHAAVTEDRRTN